MFCIASCVRFKFDHVVITVLHQFPLPDLIQSIAYIYEALRLVK